MNGPRVWNETPGRRAARSILASLAADDRLALDIRMASLAAICELEDDLPDHYVLAAVEPAPGTLQQARQLLLDDVEKQHSTRDFLATSRAAAHLAFAP